MRVFSATDRGVGETKCKLASMPTDPLLSTYSKLQILIKTSASRQTKVFKTESSGNSTTTCWPVSG